MRKTVALLMLGGGIALAGGAAAVPKPRPVEFSNASGTEATYTHGPQIAPTEPFFQDLGTNGRACGTCHDPSTGFSITPSLAQARFAATGGLDPLFRPHDGANSPSADVSTVEARATAYSMLLNRGVIRVGLPLPENAEIALDSIDDPYGFATPAQLSLFRRPLAATNLRFNATVMWDGRESQPGQTLNQSLLSQAANAHAGHAQGQPLSAEVMQRIVDFESGLSTAQLKSSLAGKLNVAGGHGGPIILSRQLYYPGINDPFKPDPRNKKFNPNIFNLFNSWKRLSPRSRSQIVRTRGSIGRGQVLFNTATFKIREVAGLNDVQGRPIIEGTCATCHNAPNAGTFSLNETMDIGVELLFPRQPDQPLYTLRNLSTGETRATTDPGRALITGKWADVGKFKVPILRGLAGRAPYFHDGSAATLEEVVRFYVNRFGLSLPNQSVVDIAEFLRSL